MKYRKGCVANQSPVKTLEAFLADGERENLINLAKLINHNLIFYRSIKGVVKPAIPYRKIEVEGIPCAVCKRQGDTDSVLLDPVSGGLIMSGQSSVPKLKMSFKALIKDIGIFSMKTTIAAAQEMDTQETLRRDYGYHD